MFLLILEPVGKRNVPEPGPVFLPVSEVKFRRSRKPSKTPCSRRKTRGIAIVLHIFSLLFFFFSLASFLIVYTILTMIVAYVRSCSILFRSKYRFSIFFWFYLICFFLSLFFFDFSFLSQAGLDNLERLGVTGVYLIKMHRLWEFVDGACVCVE